MKSVLVIDDEPGTGELVSWCLDPLGVRVLLARSLSTALEAAKHEEIGLVLLDLDLSEEDGLAILPSLPDGPGLASAPVVAFTAHDSRRQEAFEHRVVSFIGRPFANADLQGTVEVHFVR